MVTSYVHSAETGALEVEAKKMEKQSPFSIMLSDIAEEVTKGPQGEPATRLFVTGALCSPTGAAQRRVRLLVCLAPGCDISLSFNM